MHQGGAYRQSGARFLSDGQTITLKVENFAGTKFRGFRGFKGQPRNLIPAKPLTLPIREI